MNTKTILVLSILIITLLSILMLSIIFKFAADVLKTIPYIPISTLHLLFFIFLLLVLVSTACTLSIACYLQHTYTLSIVCYPSQPCV